MVSELLTSFDTVLSGEKGTTFELFCGGFDGNICLCLSIELTTHGS